MKSRRFSLGSLGSLPVLPLVLVAQQACAAPETKLYVLSSRADDMTVIDVATNEILRRVTVGKLPHGIAASPSQEVLYVANEGEDSLSVVDTRTDTVTATHRGFGRRPNEIEITPDGRTIYVPIQGEGRYEVFDVSKKEIVARIPVDGYAHNVVCSPDGRWMYLSPCDRGGTSEESARAQGLPTSLSRHMVVADARAHTIAAKVEVPNAPRPIAVSPDGKRVYLNTDNLLGFLVIDTSARKVIHKVEYDLTAEERKAPSRSHGIGVTPDGKEVWSTDTTNGLVHVFDAMREPPKQVARVQVGKVPYWLTFTPDGKTIYVSNTADDTVSAVDVKRKTEVTRISVGKGKSPKRSLVVAVPEAPPAVR
ncbi:MAG: beta-propeller fold lactonase family protein [Planctomycetes bacterium]|nr:beta-propeller fold lactonase family protein [Planctomycetota bacterium]